MHDFNNRKTKKDKKHMNKNRSRKRNRKKGDSLYKVSNEISKEERKKFCIWNYISNFFQK